MRFCLLLACLSALPSEGQRNHVVRVVTVSQDGLGKSSGLIEDTLSRLEQAASFRPDIACLPELFTGGAPELVPGPTTERVGQWARRHSSYAVFGLKTRMENKVYNSAILIDRTGHVMGRYDKLHPTEGELKTGIRPGVADAPVFQTDFGTIGIQICFDVNWWETWKRLKEKGARIVFFPSAYPAVRHLAAIALLNQYYIVSSPNTRAARIYDITGEVLAASGTYQPWAAAAIPMGKRLFEIDYHTDKARRIQRKYGPKIDLTWYHEDDWFTLASLDPDVTVEDLMAEFGLTPLNDYRVRAEKAVAAARDR